MFFLLDTSRAASARHIIRREGAARGVASSRTRLMQPLVPGTATVDAVAHQQY